MIVTDACDIIVLCWLHDALRQWRVECVLPYVVSLWKRIVAMQELHDDPDLQAMASSVLNALVQFVYPPAMVEKLLDEFVTVLTQSESWRIRTRTLPMLQVFFFRNLFNMSSDQIVRVMSVVGGLLLNAQIEASVMMMILFLEWGLLVSSSLCRSIADRLYICIIIITGTTNGIYHVGWSCAMFTTRCH